MNSMKTESILVANVKCSGCASTIKNELLKIMGVSGVEVEVENDTVQVEYENQEREVIVKRLHDLGYPEATEKNGLLLQLKSYASCMIGRVSNR
jgi:copper chaperone